MIDREPIFQALFALAATVNWGTVDAPIGFKTTSRRIKLFSDVPDSSQPWLGQAEHSEQITQKSNLPYVGILEVDWLIYHRDGDQPSHNPTVLTNRIITAVEQALVPKVQDPGYFDGRNTLLGLVYHCFISGKVLKDPGDIDNQALIMIPIKLLVP